MLFSAHNFCDDVQKDKRKIILMLWKYNMEVLNIGLMAYDV